MDTHDGVTRLECGIGPGLDYDAGVFVAERSRHWDLGMTAEECLYIGAACGSGLHLDEQFSGSWLGSLDLLEAQAARMI
jgi:hypothetical protein